jgi:hypothetical protein
MQCKHDACEKAHVLTLDASMDCNEMAMINDYRTDVRASERTTRI